MGVGEENILLQRLRVSEGRLNPAVPKEALNLLQRHPALQGDGRSCVPEDVRRDMAGDIAAGQDLRDLILYSLHLQPAMGSAAPDEQRRVLIGSGRQVRAEGYFSFRVEERRAAFSSFSALNVDCVIREADVRDIQGAEFGHAAGGTVQEIHQRLLPERLTDAAHGFKFQGRHRQPLRTVNADRRYPADRILPDEILLAAPFEETIQAQPDALQRTVHDVVLSLVLEQVDTDVVGVDIFDGFLDGGEKLSQPEQVQIERAF